MSRRDAANALSAESRRLRIADERARDDRDRAADDHAAGAPSLLCTVTTGAAAAYCTVTPCDVTGAETAGGAGTLTAAGSSFPALNLGGGNPPAGTAVVVTFVPYRWVFYYNG